MCRKVCRFVPRRLPRVRIVRRLLVLLLFAWLSCKNDLSVIVGYVIPVPCTVLDVCLVVVNLLNG